MPRPKVRTSGESSFQQILVGGCAGWLAAIYIRRSDRDQSGYSPAVQESVARALCTTYRLEVYNQVYFDDDVSGGNTARPQFDFIHLRRSRGVGEGISQASE